MASVVPLLWWGAGLAGVTAGLRRVAIAAWVLNGQAIFFSSYILSEGLFTAIVFAAVVLLIFSEHSDRAAARFAVPAAMALLSVSYLIRYAAILVVAGIIVYAGWLAIRRDSRFWLWLSSLPICLAPIVCVMIRNLHIAGTWKGGNDVVVHHSFRSVLLASIQVGYLLPFGPVSRARLATASGRATFAVGVCIAMTLLAIAVIVFASGKKAGIRVLLRSPVPLLFTLLAGYGAGMFYLGIHTVISFGTRYFVPMYPEFILLCSAVLTHYWLATSEPGIRRAIPLFATIAMFCCASLNLYNLDHFSIPSHYAKLVAFFAEPTPDGTPLRRWVDDMIPANAPVVATSGQATGYFLHRPTISTVDQAMSARRWSEDEVQQTMATYHARYLITYPGLTPEYALEQQESQFLHGLSEGKHPSWLVPMVRTPDVAIYGMQTTAQGDSLTSRARPD